MRYAYKIVVFAVDSEIVEHQAAIREEKALTDWEFYNFGLFAGNCHMLFRRPELTP